MTCDKAAQIHAYLDDEMDVAQREELEAHLLQCAECQRLLNEIRGLSSLIIGSSHPVPMRAGAMATYYGAWRAARDRAVMRITGWLTAAAAVLLIGALLLGPVRTSPTVAAKPKPGIWEVMVVTPPVETHGEANSDLVQVAQWMADDLSSSGGRSR
jgi:anti-sigma factor RsiW